MNDIEEQREMHASGEFYAAHLPKRRRLLAILPHYNDSHRLADALDCYLHSTRPPDRIVVVDDGSLPEHLSAATHICRRRGVELLALEANIGVPAAINVGLAESGPGEDYVFFGACDDRVLPHFFESACNWLDRYPQAGVVSAMGEWVDEATEKRIEVGYGTPAYFGPDRVADKFICNHVAVYRKATLAWFNPEAGPFSDWLLAQRVTQKHGACFTGMIGGGMLLRQASYYNTNPDRTKHLCRTIGILESIGLLDRVNTEALGMAGYWLLPDRLRTPARWWRHWWREIKARHWRKLPQRALDLIGGRV